MRETEVVLRPVVAEDLPLLGGGDAPYDDFGPRAPRTEPYSPELREFGGLAVCDAAGLLLGSVSWIWQQWGPMPESRNPMIGIWLRPEARGRGAGTAAQRALVDLFFRHTTVNRVEACTDVENLAEQRALEKAGFTREGAVRGAQWRAGSFHDCYSYSILRADRTG
ncbi:GNAT family N-acetyltransferase [Nocardioides daeguensis]|uniref:N-acetyltransferase domain-containing protein n=1 Tax=Nocardioides daeguensis TaxID=908359 RepID=A0ABP6WC48_9ACTN|nr:GNAT family protein [Nocardioides daeguensis]MBV6728058.1 GNAT family N-acetyltransferase [Nocardioides daeguensis]MCR1774132.1 GNAT family N-acetyltransferase [Nocardioides daeguensis]